MNRADLLEAIARYYAGDHDAAASALDAVLECISTELAAGGVVSVAGFGTFQTVSRPPRSVRDPRTGRQRRVKAAPIPQFRPAAKLRALAAGTEKPARAPERIVAHKTARAAARRLTRDNQAAELTRHVATFDPRQASDYLFAADPGSPTALELAAAAVPPAFSWPSTELIPDPVRPDPRPTSTSPLPQADVLVVTYGPAESHALADVLTPNWPISRWYPYRNGWQQLKRTVAEGRQVPSRTNDRAGVWATTQVAGTRAVLVKADLHPGTDDGFGPLVDLWSQVIDQVQPRLVITTGSAAGTGALNLGDVVVSRHLASADLDNPQAPGLTTAQLEECVSSASLRSTRLPLVVKLLPGVTAMLPHAPRPPQIWTDTRARPVSVVTAAAFAADLDLEPVRKEHGQVAVDTTDAALAKACARLTAPPPWVSIRAIISTHAQHQQHPDRAAAAASHEQFAYAACLGSALACWGLIAGRPA